MAVLIRLMKPSDAAAVARVSEACFDAPWTAEDLRLEPERRGALALVADVDSEIVGYVLLRAVLDESELLSLGVRPSARGRGVGRVLVNEALRRSVVSGVVHVHLEVRADNQPAAALYEAAGFEEVGRRPGYYAGGADARLMTWAAKGKTPPPPPG